MAQAFRLPPIVTHTRTVWRGVALPPSARPAGTELPVAAPAPLILSALKQAEDRDTFILRFYNPSDHAVGPGALLRPAAGPTLPPR